MAEDEGRIRAHAAPADEERIREYEERLQLESLKRKVSMMKFPARENKKPKLAFSKSLSSLGSAPPRPPALAAHTPLQLKLKSSAKATKLPEIKLSQASKSRIADKPWKFATKNVDECGICSDALFSLCHPHVSSAAERRRAEGATFPCSTCRTTHPKQEQGKRRVLLGSSTLHNLWKEATFAPGHHVDFDCIIGGRVHDVHAAFLEQYLEEPLPMDVVLACGVDNLPTADTAGDIVFSLQSFIKSIKEQNRDNRVVVASLPFAPKYCDVGVPPSRNMVAKVRQVNTWVDGYNRAATGLELALARVGVEGDPAEGEVRHVYSDWREPSIDRKLHLAAGARAQVAASLVEVYRGLDREGIIC